MFNEDEKAPLNNSSAQAPEQEVQVHSGEAQEGTGSLVSCGGKVAIASGLLLGLPVAGVLEVFGAAGAVWGTGSVLTWRTDYTEEYSREACLVVGTLAVLKYIATYGQSCSKFCTVNKSTMSGCGLFLEAAADPRQGVAALVRPAPVTLPPVSGEPLPANAV